MPRISNSDIPDQGIGQKKLLFRERLMNRFAGHDWVRVINPDDEAYVWQYLPSFAEEFEFTPDPMKITRRGEVEAYKLEPGESEVILGENAYVMIEGLYKRMAGKAKVRANPNVAPGFARSFAWDDGIQQEEFIKQIYLGKENPEFADKPHRVPEDIGLEKPQPARIRQAPQRA